MGEVDPAFIQEYEHRPKLNVTEAGGFPVIDLSPLNNSELSNDQQLIGSLVSEIGNACKDWGFFQVINHGVHSDLQKRIELVARKENPLGYYDTEHTKNVRDWKEVFDFTVSNPTILPALHNPEDHEVALFCRQTSSAEEKTIHLLQSPEYTFSGTDEDISPESVVCAGGGVIISPSGAILAGPNYEGEALISADLACFKDYSKRTALPIHVAACRFLCSAT